MNSSYVPDWYYANNMIGLDQTSFPNQGSREFVTGADRQLGERIREPGERNVHSAQQTTGYAGYYGGQLAPAVSRVAGM